MLSLHHGVHLSDERSEGGRARGAVGGGVPRAGEARAFDRSWRAHRFEASQSYFVRGTAQTQMQLACRCQWEICRDYIGDGRCRCLEVGAGRGSLSAYAADAGHDVTLADTSAAILAVAQESFARHRLACAAVVADTLALPFDDGSFDVVLSFGLLEHFEDIERPLAEQLRVLRPGGAFLAIVVPGAWSIQRLAAPINAALRLVAATRGTGRSKTPLYRTRYPAAAYADVLRSLGCRDVVASGMFPVPSLSASPEFPFTPLPGWVERRLASLWRPVIAARTWALRRHGWLCGERIGQHVFVAARKGSTHA